MKTSLTYKFVEFIPDILEAGILYITVEYKSAVHLCACGCDNKVVTPITPTDWKLTYDGKSVTLSPSIGNWNLECRSHYWIRRNEIIEAPSWSQEKVDYSRKKDAKKKRGFFKRRKKD